MNNKNEKIIKKNMIKMIELIKIIEIRNELNNMM